MKKSQRWNIMATIFMCAAAIGVLFKLNIWIAPVSTVCMFVALYYQIRNEDIEKLETPCGKEFDNWNCQTMTICIENGQFELCKKKAKNND